MPPVASEPEALYGNAAVTETKDKEKEGEGARQIQATQLDHDCTLTYAHHTTVDETAGFLNTLLTQAVLQVRLAPTHGQ